MIRTLTVIYSAAAFLIGITAGYVALGAGRSAHVNQTPSAQASYNGSNGPNFQLHTIHKHMPMKAWTAAHAALAAPSVTQLPMWNYSVKAGADLGGGTFSGTMVGRSPFDRGKTKTVIPTQVIPLIITIDNGGADKKVYDPTVADGCVGSSADTILINSPVFSNTNWNLNGVTYTNTQYIDAFQRAEFDTLVHGTPYQLILSPTVLPAQSLTFGNNGTSGPGSNNAFGCGGNGSIGVVQVQDLDNALNNLIAGPLAGTVNIGTFPIFVLRNVVSTESGTNIGSQCCILGYHSSIGGGSNLQMYSPLSIDTTGAFGPGFTSALSHEMAEAINDPNGANFTPAWGDEGQVPLGHCQNNLEVGDPLSGTNLPTISLNGLNYRVQELAFFSWFFGGASLGSGGKFSSNGTFGGDAKPCPNGGSN